MWFGIICGPIWGHFRSGDHFRSGICGAVQNQDTEIMINNNLITTRQITLHIICINFQVVFFENSFREFGTLIAVCEEIIKLHIFTESRQEYFFKKGAHL